MGAENERKELEIERGGQVIGDIQVFGENAPKGRKARTAKDKDKDTPAK